MIDGMVERMEAELGYACKVIATGSLAQDIIPCCRRPGILVDNELLLRGLWTLYQKNR
jgi:type III pantothenate kinase